MKYRCTNIDNSLNYRYNFTLNKYYKSMFDYCNEIFFVGDNGMRIHPYKMTNGEYGYFDYRFKMCREEKLKRILYETKE
jgi:hypothetical protein